MDSLHVAWALNIIVTFSDSAVSYCLDVFDGCIGLPELNRDFMSSGMSMPGDGAAPPPRASLSSYCFAHAGCHLWRLATYVLGSSSERRRTCNITMYEYDGI